MLQFAWIFLFLLIIITVSCNLTITLLQGELFGKLLKTENGKEYYSYTGVPYAKPPVGELRFKPPVNAEPWEGILNATETRSACRSLDIFTKKLEGSEDCLYLNVFVPKILSNEPLPIFFWIHGGGFVSGNGNPEFHGPDYFMEHDVIVVTINYRLGPFGFLNLELEGAPGNVGLKDQVEALKWCKENIAKFGGDPQNVAIAGVSAGGASVHYLLLSHASTGLFQKAIIHSGSAFNPWAFQKNPIERAFQLCKALGHQTNSTKDALEFLNTMPMDNFLIVQLPAEVDGQLINDFIFVPSVEKEFPSHQPFLKETPLDRMKSGKFNKLPIIAGFNSREGIIYKHFERTKPTILRELEDDSEKSVPTDLDLKHGSQASKNLGKKIIKFYFDNKPVSENPEIYADLYGDDWITRGMNKHIILSVEKQTEPIYYYEYFFDEVAPTKYLIGDHNLQGASHGDETTHILKTDFSPLQKNNSNVVLIQKRMIKMWTNFIKFGNPTPEVTDLLPMTWIPVTREKLNYLKIDVNMTMDTNPEERRIKFWENIEKELENAKKEAENCID